VPERGQLRQDVDDLLLQGRAGHQDLGAAVLQAILDRVLAARRDQHVRRHALQVCADPLAALGRVQPLALVVGDPQKDQLLGSQPEQRRSAALLLSADSDLSLAAVPAPNSSQTKGRSLQCCLRSAKNLSTVPDSRIHLRIT
jgi:hypothetical protein